MLASKTGESFSAQTSSDALYCKWGTISFNNLVQEYDIKPEWNPVLPSKQDTTFPLKQGKITLFSDFFKFCNFRLLITKFCKSVLDEYPIHISQLHPLGLVKLRHLKFAFDRRDIGVSCLRDIPTSSRDKDWKKKEMGAKEKFKDDGPPADAYVENALFKRLSQRPSECSVIPEGALVMAGMSLLWRDSWLYPAFQRVDEGTPADRAIGEHELDVLRIHLEQFLLPTVPADPNAYVSQPPPSGGGGGGGGGVFIVETKKPSRIKISERKVITAGTTTSPATVSISAAPGSVVTSASTSLVSPQRALKKRRMMPPLTAFQAIKVAHALPAGSFVEAQVKGVSSMPLSSGEIVSSAAGGQSLPLADLISRASAIVVNSSLPSPLFTAAVEMPTTSVAGESTSARDTTVSDAGGSSGGFVDDGARLADDLYLPTICWDSYAQDKRYQPKWKIVESSRLVFPPVVHHWVEQAYPPDESTYVEGLDNENLMNATMVDAVSQPRRLAEIRRRWMHDNNELHQVQERYQGLTVELEASNARAQAKQVELEDREKQLRKLQQVCDSLVSEKNQLFQYSTAQQARLKEAKNALDQSNARVDSLTSHLAGLLGDRNWLITNGLVWAFEYLRQSESFVTLLDRLSTAAYKSGHHDGIYEGYFNCQQTGRITPVFQESRGKLTTEMADALEAVYNDPLPAYAELVDKVAEDGVDSLCRMLDVAEESGEE
ncbi:hypothetical protein Hanom_Chr03g00225571 [Helianthus anomalus]